MTGTQWRTRKARFKYTLRLCRKEENRHSRNSLAKKLLSKNDKSFWKEIKQTKERHMNTAIPETVGGHTGQQDVSNMWKQYFSNLLNSSQIRNNYQVPEVSLESFQVITGDEVAEAMKNLKKGKSPGSDGIQAEHLKYSDDCLCDLLAKLFNCFIIHGYLPKAFMYTVLVPVVKDKKNDLSDCDNYRPIALTTIISKLLEIVILKRCKEFLVTTDNQFGFKQGHGTEQCVFTLKHVIDFYTKNSSPLYICFLDLSKAFDRVNHSILWRKLYNRGMHTLFLRILMNWYSTQSFAVKWGHTVSSKFYVSNGTRQGSILSPYLFNCYIDELSFLLKGTCSGCFLNGNCFNHLFYADDAVLLAPSPVALQKLIDQCYKFSVENDLMFSTKKTKVMYLSNERRNFNCPSFYLNRTKLPLVTEYTYLGVVLSNCGTDKLAMQKTVRSIYTKGNVIKSKFNACTEEVKLKLFSSYCCSFYCCSLWENYSQAQYDDVKISHNNVLRYFIKTNNLDSISGHFISRNLNNCDVIVRKSVFSLYKRLLASNNVLIETIVGSQYFTYSKMYIKWKDILFLLG